MKKTIWLMAYGLWLMALSATPVQAQVPIKDAFKSPFQDFGTLVSVIVSNAYILAGVVILFLLIFAGLGILMGAGSGDQQKTAQGKQAFTAAVIGFLIIFTSYWIIQLIEKVTGLEILNPKL